MEIQCKYNEWPWIDTHRYTCIIKKKPIPDSQNAKIIGRHLLPNTSYDVTGVNFMNCGMAKIPNKLLMENYPFLQALALSNCSLKTISRENFIGLSDLKVLWLNDNELEFLPGDLFEDVRRLEFVSFEKNKIRYIDPEVLDPLTNLQLVNFFGNVGIDKVYNKKFLTQGNASLDEVKNEIVFKCRPPWRSEGFRNVGGEDDLKEKLALTNYECNFLKEKCRKLEEKVEKMNEEISKLKFGLFRDIQEFLTNEELKDFTICVNGESFKVHKFILIARSSILAEMITKNPTVDSLNLTDVSVDTFKIIVDFFYNDRMPDDETNFVEIFAAAGKLDIKELVTFTGRKLVESVDSVNAFELLVLSNKYENEELRERAFEEISKIFPDRELKVELARNPEKVWKLIEMKKKLDEELEKV